MCLFLAKISTAEFKLIGHKGVFDSTSSTPTLSTLILLVELDGIVYFLMTINSVACASLINAIQTADGKYNI